MAGHGVTISKNEEKLKFIHPSLINKFKETVVECYDPYAYFHEYVVITDWYHTGIVEFADYFDDCWEIGFESSLRFKYPESQWNNMPEEEVNEHREDLYDCMAGFDDELMADVLRVLDARNLFYVKGYIGWYSSYGETLELTGWKNSPIQEVW